MGDQINTQRLVLRRYRPQDAECITALVQDARIYRNVGRIEKNQTLTTTQAFFDRSAASWDAGTGYGFAITLDGALIGVVGGGAGEPGLPLDVGYWIGVDHWGRGYASEAFAAYLDWLAGEKGQRGVTAGYFADNPASGRVLRKTGFLPCGRSPYFCVGRDEWVTSLDMARIA